MELLNMRTVMKCWPFLGTMCACQEFFKISGFKVNDTSKDLLKLRASLQREHICFSTKGLSKCPKCNKEFDYFMIQGDRQICKLLNQVLTQIHGISSKGLSRDKWEYTVQPSRIRGFWTGHGDQQRHRKQRK
nr:hypothetical protein Iba_chr01cCG15060 [Ipomoea batatas]